MAKWTLIILAILVVSVQADNIYGSLDPSKYLVGQFDQTRATDLFALIEGIPTQYPMMLRKEALDALRAMLSAFSQQNPTIPVPVLSATRNYTYQKGIWEKKWNGQYSNVNGSLSRALAIMEYSAMPGSSRHHWGTDVDLFSLSNPDFDKGNGKVLYSWLQQNAAKFGFCQPYTLARCAGYNEEKWHWSFKPLSSRFLSDWNKYFAGNGLCNWGKLVDFSGSQNAVTIVYPFVNVINSDCY